MADTGIFATTAQVQSKVGANASAVSNTEAYINDYMLQAESLINATCRFNFSDAYAALDADVKSLLTVAASAKAAMWVLAYDPSGIPRIEFETRLDVLNNDYTDAIAKLKDKNVQEFMSDV